jgi:hypothetical protein
VIEVSAFGDSLCCPGDNLIAGDGTLPAHAAEQSDRLHFVFLLNDSFSEILYHNLGNN